MTREITIVPVLNGYICNVGCQRVVFQDRKAMLSEIGEYLQHPDKTEKRYQDTAVNKMSLQPNCPPPCDPIPCGCGVSEAPSPTTTAGQILRRR
jgi:hypothetical protein